MIDKLSTNIKLENDYILTKVLIFKSEGPFNNNSFNRFVFEIRWKWVIFQVVYRPLYKAHISAVFVYHSLGNFTTPNCLKNDWQIPTDFSKIHIYLEDCRKKLTSNGSLS